MARSELNRIDYLILNVLYNNKAINPMLGLTIKELNITEVKRTCLCNHLYFLMESNLICQSGKYGKQKMYYITEQGIERMMINEG